MLQVEKDSTKLTATTSATTSATKKLSQVANIYSTLLAGFQSLTLKKTQSEPPDSMAKWLIAEAPEAETSAIDDHVKESKI